MYHPYFRGKQYELIAIRESAQQLAAMNFVPIIEPVRSQTKGLEVALGAICAAGGAVIVIINPKIGDHNDGSAQLVEFLGQSFDEHKENVILGILLTEDQSVDDILAVCQELEEWSLALVHAGFSGGRALANRLAKDEVENLFGSVFLDSYCGKLYQRHFSSHPKRVLVRDGFERRRNRDHPDEPEFFSDLHVTYELEGMNGFGDFLIVGDEFLESGGPAYTVAIHLTFIDDEEEGAMYLQHFKSDRQDSPADPAGKFAEALSKLITVLDSPESKYFEGSAIREFRDLHDRGHYPGLGYVKKLSMIHHIETMAHYFESA